LLLLFPNVARADNPKVGWAAPSSRVILSAAIPIEEEPKPATHWYGLETIAGLVLSDAALVGAFVAGDAGNTPLAVSLGILGGTGHLAWPAVVHLAHSHRESLVYTLIYTPLFTAIGMLAATGACASGGHPYRRCPPSTGPVAPGDTGRAVAIGAWAGAAVGNITDLAGGHLETVPNTHRAQSALSPWVGPNTWGLQWGALW
jgi:hypothetical protein